jgi:hypothetical protein
LYLPGTCAMASEQQEIPDQVSSAEAVSKAIRALVREELNKSTPVSDIKTGPKPTWQDGAWLLILIVNAVLLVDVVPQEWWKNPGLEITSKVLPWLGGGTFVLGATWFREHILALSRKRFFKITMACSLAPLLVFHLPFVSLHPIVDPPDAELYVDGVNKGSFHGSEKARLRLWNHRFQIQPYNSTSVPPRVIEWTWRRLMAAWWKNEQPHWALIYPVTIVSEGKGCVIHLRKESLDTDFSDEHLKRAGDHLDFAPNQNSEQINLPAGIYTISVDRPRCETLIHPASVSVSSEEIIELAEMKCKR